MESFVDTIDREDCREKSEIMNLLYGDPQAADVLGSGGKKEPIREGWRFDDGKWLASWNITDKRSVCTCLEPGM